MNEERKFEELEKMSDQNQDHIYEVLDQLISVAHVDSAFSEPVTSGETTIVSVSEVISTAGVGYGGGFGILKPGKDASEENKYKQGGGSGGGGGGVSLVRPVAVIKIHGDDVTVVPIIDKTKLMIAALTIAVSFGVIMSKIVFLSKMVGKHSRFH